MYQEELWQRHSSKRCPYQSQPPYEGIYRGLLQNFNPLCGRNPMRTDLD